ncbi:hypothetical protein NMY22_g5283 [Coprinellus aureogranulatus]|nr:hypothetical protein NMY22_g5283 [Coprinellus aureogranulatus]
MSRMMMSRLSFTHGSREANKKHREGEQAPEAVSLPTLDAIPHTPMRSANETEAEKKERDVKVLMSGPTKVIVTAPTPGTGRHAEQDVAI